MKQLGGGQYKIEESYAKGGVVEEEKRWILDLAGSTDGEGLYEIAMSLEVSYNYGDYDPDDEDSQDELYDAIIKVLKEDATDKDITRAYDMLNETYAKGGRLKGITDGEPIKERQIVLLKNRWSKGVRDKETTEAMDYVNSNEVMITPEQTKKGLAFLKNLWKTPSGRERKNNPFGFREQKALETFEYFTLDGFTNITTGSSWAGYDWYVPIYSVHGDTGYFQYYYDGKVKHNRSKRKAT